ncbi:adhesin [Herbaspirillum huttiense]|uniref:Adhesin n=2 Tax=Herbaspirillum huttiense TaxID=863372 RepID=A0AAJ2LR94_9BURK|nr:adhesin [Herbaspirillum huttiense]MDR9835834.1 adhesin [Herbaspirillum huttiense]
MSITVLNLTEASALLRTINKRDIKDVRAIDLDLALVLESGHKIIISRGAVAAVNSPQLILEFADGDIALGDVFEKLNHIEVPADAAVTVTSKEITRYGIKRVVKPKVARNKQDQEADQDKKDEEDSAKSDADEARPAESLAGHDGSGGSDIPARKFTSGKGSSSSLALQELADAPTDAGSSKGGISWPVIAGGLGLLAAAGGGGGGGGSGAGAGSGGGSGGGVATTLSGAAALGPLNNATITAYDAEGRVIGKAVPVINGRYTLVLDQSGYKGLILLAIRDNTPGVRDNYADEASVSITDLGSTVLRAVALADGSNQIINVTALTELAALKAGLGTGQTNLAAAQVGATTVTGANAAVSSLFKVDILSGDVTPVTTTDAQGAAVINPAFLQSASVTARNYGIALKAIANLVQTNKERYADNGEAIRKLADALQFTDGLQRRLKWKDGTTQSDLFGDSLNARANDPALSQSVRDEARRLYDQLQKLPNGSSVSDYLLENHIGLPEPAILLKNTTAGGPVWAPPGNDGTVILNQDDITNGGLAVRAPPQSKVEVTFIGFDAQGKEVRVTLPASTADGSGFAVLRPPEAAVALLKQMTREQSVTAKVAVTDGDNSRSNTGLWQSNVDVRIDLNTPPGLTDFASNKIMLVNDTFYTGGDSNDDLRTTPVGHDDLLTSDGSVRVVLAGRIKSDERLQFAVATSKAANGQPVYGSWINPAELVVERIDSSNQVHYVARNLVNTEGMVWVKARVQSTGASRNGYGDARELDTPLQFTLDKTAPAQVQLVMADNGDNGLSNNDGITSQNTVRLEPQAAFEAGAEVHLRLQSGDGTSGATLRLVHANSSQENLTTDKWYRWTAGDSLQLIGASQSGSGKARLQVRQIDLAGNHAESMQTFIADSTRVIEQTVLVASREKAVLQANAAVVAAQQAFNLATAADKAARQAVLDAARTTLQTAQAERDQALTQAGTALIKPDGSTRLADLIGTPVEADYLPAILRAIAATADPDKVNQALGLSKLIDSAKQAAERALAKARIYGDNDANPALTAADFADMGIPGSDDPGTLTLANAALKVLPDAQSHTIPAVRAIVQAAARVAALADGVASNTADAALPDAAIYTTLGITTTLTPAASRVLGQVIDGKPLHQVATIASIETIANAALRVTQHAAGTNPSTPLTADDFMALGISGVTADNVARFATSLRTVPSALVTSGQVVGTVDTLAEIRAIVALDLGTLQVLMNYAQDIKPIDPAEPALQTPTLAHYTHSDLTTNGGQVTAERLAAINSAVRSVGASAVDSWSKVAVLVKSYNTILNAANGAADGTAAGLPTEADFVQVGVKSLRHSFPTAADAPARANAVKLLVQVVDRSAAEEVDTVAELDSLADIICRIVRIAGGQPESISAAEWTRLKSSQHLTAEALSVVLPALAATADDGSEVNTIASLTARAINALDSGERIRKYADNVAGATEPLLADYRNMGVTAVDDVAMVASINSVLASPIIGGADARLPGQLQAIASAYLRILGQIGNTGGTRAVPAAGDFEMIGLTPPTSAASLSLLNSVLAGGSKQRADIDTVDELRDLILASDTVLHIAAGNLGDLPAAPAARTQALLTTLGKLGVSGLQADSMPALLAVLQASPDNGSAVDTLAELQTLVTQTGNAQARLQAYADDPAQPAPTLTDYRNTGVSGADIVGHDALNTLLAGPRIGKNEIATPAQLQAIIDSFTRILDEANEVPASGGGSDLVPDVTPGSDPLLTDYSKLGLTLWGLTDPAGPNDKTTEHLSLLNDALHRKSRDQVNSLSELEALGAAVALFLDNRGVDALDAAGRQKWADAAALLGVSGLVTSGDGENLEALIQALRSRPANQIDTVAELQSLLEGGNEALSAIIAYANNSVLNPAPTVANYIATGITTGSSPVSVDMNNLASINAAVATLNGPDVNSRSKLRNVVQAYNTILAAADGMAGDDSGQALQASHYGSIGVNLALLARSPTNSEVDPDKLALFNSVVGAQTKAGVNTPQRLDNLAATAADLIRLARESLADPLSLRQDTTLSLGRLQALGLNAINDDATRRAFLDAVQFKGNRFHPGTGAPISEDTPATHDASGINSLEKLAAIATSYATLMRYVNNGGVNIPTQTDYQNVGIVLPVTNPAQALLLLNSALHAQADTSRIGSIAGLNRMALVVEQLMQLSAVAPLPGLTPAHYPAVTSTLAVADLQWLGVSGINADNLGFVLHKLQSTDDSGSALSSLAALQGLANAAISARARIIKLAQDNTGEAPTAADLEAIGLALPVNGAGSKTEYLKLFNEALQSPAVDTSRANTPALLQAIIDAAQRVVDSTAGHAPLSTTPPVLADLVALGLAPADAARATPANLTLLIDSLGARSFADLGRDHAGTALALPAKLSHLLDVIAALRDSAATGVVASSLSALHLQELGLNLTPYTNAAGSAGHHLPAILAAIAASRSDGGELGSLGALQTLVTRAGAAQEKILRYADETASPSATAPTAEDYRAIGLVRADTDASGARLPLVSADRVEAINAALHASGVAPGRVDTPSGVKTVVTAYNAILDSADGHAGNTGVAPTPQQYRDIGANIPGVTGPAGGKDEAIRSLFNSLIDSLSPGAVNTPAKIEGLGAAVGKMIGLAGQSRLQPVINAPGDGDFNHFGITGLNNEEREAFIAVLQSKPVADFDTLSELTTLAANVRASYARVIAYAENDGGAAPTLADYQTLAITGISDSGGHREAVNAALATSAVRGSNVARLNALQAVADTYRMLLQQADGTADNTATANLATLEDFERIGVDMSSLKSLDAAATGATRNAVQLLSSLVDSRRAAAIDTPAEIQQLVSVVHKLALAEQGLTTAPLQPADFALIDMPVGDAAVVDQIRTQLAALPDNGSGLNSWGQLRNLLLSVTGVPSWDAVAGDDLINRSERVAGVTLSGSAGQNDVLTLFYPDGSVMKSGITTHDAGGGKWAWSYALTNAEWTRLGADSADGVAVELQLQARNTMTSVNSIKVTHRITIDTVAPPANLMLTLEQDTGTSSGDGITSNGKVKVTGLAADAQWEYRIGSSGPYQTGVGDSFTVTQQGLQTVSVRQFDRAGNRSTEQTLALTLDTQAPAAPLIALAHVGGTVNDLPVTNRDTVNVSGVESGARLQWRLNRNDYTGNPDWNTASGATISPTGMTPNEVKNWYLEVRQVDAAGNASNVSRLGFTLDTQPPAAPSLRLVDARGSAAAGWFSNSGKIDIEGLEPMGRWQYSLNGGSTLVDGSGSRLTLPAGDGAKNLIVRQYDLAGNHTDSTPLAFTLDTTKPASPVPVLRLDSGKLANDGITTDGTVRIDNLEAGASWEYSLDSGATWSTTGISGNTVNFTDNGARRSLQVRQTDRAGNVSDASAKLEFTVDTTAPRAPRLALVTNSSGDEATRLTNDGRIDVLDLDSDTRWEYSTDGGTTWINGSGNRFTVTGDGVKHLLARQTDAAGNTAASSALTMQLDTTAPVKPGLAALVNDTGRDAHDNITREGKLKAPTASEPDLRFEYSLDGVDWKSLSEAVRGAREGGSDGLKKVKLRSIDRAGNRSATGDEFSFTLDTTAPAKLVPSLLKPMSGGSTSDGTVLIGAAEAGALWEYSLDRGTTWKPGSGDRIKIKGIDEGGTDGAKSIQLRQSDAAGNVSVSDVFEFNLQTKLDAPALKVLDTIRTLPDGTALLDAASTTLPLGPKMVLEVTGRANMTAIITRDDGIEVGRTVLDASGKGRIELGRILTIAGLKSVAGANSTANGSYQLVHSSETIFKLRNTAPYFSNAFSELNAPVVDMSKPVYRTGSGDNDWYMWSAIGGGYVISRRNDSNEWYREAPSSTPAQSPEGVKTWLAVNRTAAQVADDQARNGMSTHQRALDGVTLVNANGWRDTPWTYKAIQEAGPDNRSAPTELKVRMFTTTPPALDLDAATSGLQSNLVLSATRADLLNGLPVLSSLAVPAGPAARSIELVFNNRSVSGNDALVLDTDVLMNADRARVEDRTVAGVNGVGYQATYDSASKTTTLMLSKTAGGMFSAAEVTSILKSISLRNRLDPATELSPRTIEVRLVDEGGRRSYDAARVTIQVEGRGLQVDLDAAKPGIQLTSTQYLNHLFVSTYGLAEGSHFVRDMAAPTGAPDTIALKFKGVHPINEMVYSNDAQIANLSGTSVYFGSIGGIFGLSWWSPRDDELLIRKTTPISFSGDEVKKILEAMRMVTTNRSDIERSLEITLAAPAPAPDSGAVTGTTSRATLVMDTVAPDLDLNASQAGRQDLARSSVTTAQAAEGVKLIKGEMAAPLASDIASIVLTLPVPGTPVADRIFLGVERPFATNANFNHEGSIAGVEGLKAKFDLGTHLLTITRSDGNNLTGSQVKTILEGLRYSFTVNPSMGRQIDIALVDQAGNISKGMAVLTTDPLVPATLEASVVEGQLGYGFIRLADIFGKASVPSSFPHVLNKDEQAFLPTPAGLDATRLLGAIRGISAEWGGTGITGDGNTSIASLKSYRMVGKLNPALVSRFSLLQQGDGQDTLGNWLRLQKDRPDGAASEQVRLDILGGFKRNGMDQYKLDPDIETSITNYGLANIGVLYELNAGATSGRPVVRVGYDGSRSAEGDLIGLYEGDHLVGSKILTAGDVGAGQRTMEVTVFQSLSAGAHDLVARYTDTAGNVVNSGSMRVTVAAGAAPVTLTDLRVHGSQQSVADAKVLGQSDTTYATISDQDTRFGSGHGLRGPVFVGKVGGGAASDRYLVTIQMGGKILAFEEVGAGDFSIGIPAGSLAPGYYQDLSISASVLTPGARLGQTTTTQGLKLGWYWAAQAGTAIMGGKGNDELVVGAAADASVGTLVQTGAGDDTITVGSFGKLTGLKATVSDFVVGVDKVKVFGQVASTEFVKSYVTASNLNGSTHLQIDLDGGGPGKLYYQLTLQGVNYNPANVGSIFGL